jgi:hypothetical protein
VDIPAASACGQSVPFAIAGEPLSLSTAAPLACVELQTRALVKMGLVAQASSPADLQLAVFSPGDDAAELIRLADDGFGLDPEMSVWLDPGTYILEANSWFEEPFEGAELYLDPDGNYLRRGDVTAAYADVTPAVCDTAPRLTPGEQFTVEGRATYVCLDVAAAQPLALQAATLTDQDLVLEVVGFEDGAPYRIAWADENPYSRVLADFDPLVEMVFPAGQWVAVVGTYYGDPAANFDIRLSGSSGTP